MKRFILLLFVLICSISFSGTKDIYINTGLMQIDRAMRLHSGFNWEIATSTGIYNSCGAMLSYNDKIWLFRGMDQNLTYYNSVHYSTDGSSWTIATTSANWPIRRFFGAVVFNNKMWIIGGHLDFSGSGMNDVWSSTDGINWVCQTASAAWTPRGKIPVCVYDNKMWVFGSTDKNYTQKRDTWYSTDGINWTCATTTNPFCFEQMPVIEHDNKMWVLASSTYYTTNGANWTCATTTAAYGHRWSFAPIAYNNKMFVIGGYLNSGVDKNDVWSSTDGINWICITASAPFSVREYFPSCVHNNKIYIYGGLVQWTSPNVMRRDVWRTKFP